LLGYTVILSNDSFIDSWCLGRPRHGAGRNGEKPSGDKKKAIRICFASQKLAKPQIIKHILSPRVPIAESLTAKGATRNFDEFAVR
jgi:hypothetical protein